jgi:hypothetical protein
MEASSMPPGQTRIDMLTSLDALGSSSGHLFHVQGHHYLSEMRARNGMPPNGGEGYRYCGGRDGGKPDFKSVERTVEPSLQKLHAKTQASPSR